MKKYVQCVFGLLLTTALPARSAPARFIQRLQGGEKVTIVTMIDGLLAANPETEIILQTMNSVMDMPRGKHATNLVVEPEVPRYYLLNVRQID
jgi:hypothetical protein